MARMPERKPKIKFYFDGKRYSVLAVDGDGTAPYIAKLPNGTFLRLAIWNKRLSVAVVSCGKASEIK